MANLTRQQRKSAERRLKKDQFPFPDKYVEYYYFLKENPQYFAQADLESGEILTNLLDMEVKLVNLDEFYGILQELNQDKENKNVHQAGKGYFILREKVRS